MLFLTVQKTSEQTTVLKPRFSSGKSEHHCLCDPTGKA